MTFWDTWDVSNETMTIEYRPMRGVYLPLLTNKRSALAAIEQWEEIGEDCQFGLVCVTGDGDVTLCLVSVTSVTNVTWHPPVQISRLMTRHLQQEQSDKSLFAKIFKIKSINMSFLPLFNIIVIYSFYEWRLLYR